MRAALFLTGFKVKIYWGINKISEGKGDKKEEIKYKMVDHIPHYALLQSDIKTSLI